MKRDKLLRKLNLGEGPTVEFKEVANVAAVGQHVCAFLNSGGGYLVLGVDDAGQVLGVKTTTSIEALESSVTNGLAPKALVSFDAQEFEGATVWVIEVPAGKDIPYSFRDEVFIRPGTQMQRADVATLRDMILRRQVEPERWERRFSDADLSQDLSEEEIKRSVQRGKSTHRSEYWTEGLDESSQILERLALMKYGRLSNAGDVLFTRNPARRNPQVRVRCACFTTDKTDDTYRDFKTFEGPLVAMLEETFAFIRRNTSNRSQFAVDKLVREDVGVYPDDALREGLVNAFAHRDYADFRGGLTVQVFPHRVEIWNSGGLPEGVTLDGLARGQISVLRNPDIAHVLYLQGLMEKLGRGGVLISHACRRQGLPDPEWRTDPNGVTLTFRAPSMASGATQEVPFEVSRKVAPKVISEVTPEVTPQVTPEVDPEVTPEVAPEVTPEVAPEVTPEVAPEVTPEVAPEVTPEAIRQRNQPMKLEVSEEVSVEVAKLIDTLQGDMSRQELQRELELKDSEHFRKVYLRPALQAVLVEMTVPSKPQSSKQRYRLTALGRSLRQQRRHE